MTLDSPMKFSPYTMILTPSYKNKVTNELKTTHMPNITHNNLFYPLSLYISIFYKQPTKRLRYKDIPKLLCNINSTIIYLHKHSNTILCTSCQYKSYYSRKTQPGMYEWTKHPSPADYLFLHPTNKVKKKPP